MIRTFIAAFAALSFAVPAHASSWQDVQSLVDLIKATGTKVQAGECGQKGAAGFYAYDKDKGVDLLAICSNTVDMQDPDAVWEVMAHEATHVMQACAGGPILKDTYVPRVLRELQEYAPHYYQVLSTYRGSHKRKELEAFWMELRSPDVPIKFFKQFCYED